MRRDALVFANARRLAPRRSINRKNCARLSGLVVIFLQSYSNGNHSLCRSGCGHHQDPLPAPGPGKAMHRDSAFQVPAGTPAPHTPHRPGMVVALVAVGEPGFQVLLEAAIEHALARSARLVPPKCAFPSQRDAELQGAALRLFLRAVKSCLRAHSPDSSPTARLAVVAFIHRFRRPLPAQFQTVALASHFARESRNARGATKRRPCCRIRSGSMRLPGSM